MILLSLKHNSKPVILNLGYANLSATQTARVFPNLIDFFILVVCTYQKVENCYLGLYLEQCFNCKRYLIVYQDSKPVIFNLGYTNRTPCEMQTAQACTQGLKFNKFFYVSTERLRTTAVKLLFSLTEMLYLA